MQTILKQFSVLSRRGLIFFLLLILAGFGVACTQPAEVSMPTPASISSVHYEVGPIFRELYVYLGGQEVLGPAISDVLTEDATYVQYTENAKLIFNPQAPVGARFSLSPLGRLIVFNEPAVPTPSNPGIPYLEGHTIAPEFIAKYEELGAWVVGLPLTEVRYNPNHQRYEQYFENVGFYRLKGSSDVKLLAYGVVLCDRLCRAEAPSDARIDINHYIDPTFLAFVNKMGADFTGFALSDAHFSSDGKWEQVMENVVLIADAPGKPETVILRPIVNDLHFVTEPPRAASGEANMIFVATAGDVNNPLGYDVPLYFWDYLRQHGELGISGAPVMHLARRDSLTYVQCFVNLCLKYDASVPESVRVRPEPNGYAYMLLRYPTSQQDQAPAEAVTITPLQQVTTMQVWETYPALDTRFQQEIGVLVRTDGQPVAGARPALVLTLPGGSQQTYSLPPTGPDGKSSLLLPPLQADNTMLFLYKVCVPGLGGDTFCVEDSFVIWNNP